MGNTIKKCKTCKGLGLIHVNKMDAHGGYTCPVCKGFGVPLYDEEFDNALSFLERENKDLDDENE